MQHTPATIAALPDRELDALLAALLGWTSVRRESSDSGYDFGYRGTPPYDPTWRDYIPRYSTDHASAAAAVALLIQKKPEAEINIDYNPEGWSVEWLLMDEKYNAITTRRCATEPRAKAECCVLVLLKMKESEDD